MTTPTNPQPREVLQCDRDRAYALWQSEGTGPYMPEVWAQAFAAHRQAAEASTHIDPAFVLPCDVKLPPATTIKAGCDLKTLMTALSLEGRPVEFPERRPADPDLKIEANVDRLLLEENIHLRRKLGYLPPRPGEAVLAENTPEDRRWAMRQDWQTRPEASAQRDQSWFFRKAIETAISFTPKGRRLVVCPFHQSIHFNERPSLHPNREWELLAPFKYIAVDDPVPDGWFEGSAILVPEASAQPGEREAIAKIIRQELWDEQNSGRDAEACADRAVERILALRAPRADIAEVEG